jgi:hypothetical protein
MNEFRIETYRIFNITDLGEYRKLTDKQEKLYNLIMSMGIVNLNEISSARNILWDMFPEGTITGDALRDPVNRFILIPQEEEK